MARWVRIDDERAIHALVDVPLQRQSMTVIEMAAERPGIELIDELITGIDEPRARNTIHPRCVDAVEMHRMRMGAEVPEYDPKAIAFRRSEGRPWHTSVVGPRRKHDARGNLDFLVLSGDFECSQCAAVR